MERKILTLFLMLSMAFLLSGCGKKETSKDAPSQKQEAANTEETKKETVNEESVIPEDFNGSAEELMKKGKPVKCTAKYTDGDTESESVYYIDAKFKRMRVIAKNIDKMDNKVEEYTSNLLNDEKIQYMWKEGETTGVKFDIPKEDNVTENEIDEPSKNDGNNSSDELDDEFNKNMKFKCEKWDVDDSLFKVPDNIEFSSLGDLVPSLPSMPVAE